MLNLQDLSLQSQRGAPSKYESSASEARWSHYQHPVSRTCLWTHPVLCSDSRRSSGDAFLPSVSGSRRQSGGTAEEMRLGFIRQATARGVRPNMVSRVELW